MEFLVTERPDNLSVVRVYMRPAMGLRYSYVATFFNFKEARRWLDTKCNWEYSYKYSDEYNNLIYEASDYGNPDWQRGMSYLVRKERAAEDEVIQRANGEVYYYV